MIGFGEWLPDQSNFLNPGITIARNVIPAANSYIPAPDFVQGVIPPVSVFPPFLEGGIATLNGDAQPMLIVGTPTSLLRINYPLGDKGPPSIDNVSRLAGYTDLRNFPNATWEFAEFRGDLYATNTVDQLQVLKADITVTPRFQDVLATTDVVPRMREIATVGAHLVLGRESRATGGQNASYIVRWCGTGNATQWAPGQNLSDQYRFHSRVQRIIGGETGAVLTTDASYRMDYQGAPPDIFKFSEISKTGVAERRSVVAYDRYIWYLSASGFWEIADYSTARPIGSEKVDRFIRGFALEAMCGAYDPMSNRVYWTYGGTSKQQDQASVIVYDRYTERWSLIDTQQQYLLNSYMDAKTPQIYAATADGIVRSLTGVKTSAVIETGEWGGKERTQVNVVRPYIQGTPATVVTIQMGTRNKQTDPVVWGPEVPIDSDGNAKVRSEAFFQRIRFNINGGFQHAVGYDLDPEPPKITGRR